MEDALAILAFGAALAFGIALASGWIDPGPVGFVILIGAGVAVRAVQTVLGILSAIADLLAGRRDRLIPAPARPRAPRPPSHTPSKTSDQGIASPRTAASAPG